MIRILHCVHGMNRGGIETFIMNIYRCLDRTKLQFDFLVNTKEKCDYDDEIKALGGRIYYVPGRREGLLKSKIKTNEFFQKHKEYKIVHVHMSSLSNISILSAAKKNAIPCRIIHSHSTKVSGNKIHIVLHKLNKLFISTLATNYFACSNTAAKWMYPKKLYLNQKYKIVKNGIEPEKFNFNLNVRIQKRNELGISNRFVIGHIGRFHPVKNHHFLIDIFYEIYKIDKSALLLLVGEGNLRSEIENKVENLGLKNNVMFLGVRSDIPELLQAMDAFVLPSFYEGLPVVLIEAQATGLKCYTSKNVVTNESNVCNLVEFISIKDSAETWAKKILENRYYKRIQTQKMIKDSGYDIRIVAKEIEDLYKSVI